MQVIRNVLILMGALIVVGFLFLGYVIYQRMSGVGQFAKGHDEMAPADLTNLAVLTSLGLPNDARVEAIHDIGNRVLLLIRHPSFGDRLYMVDPRTGAVLSAIAVGQATPTLPGHGPAAVAPLVSATPAPVPAPVPPPAAAAVPPPASVKAAPPSANKPAR